MFMESGLEPKKDIFALDNLIAWLEQQPSDGTYDYSSPFSCLLARYFKDQGKIDVGIGNETYNFSGGIESGYLPKGWMEVASGHTKGYARMNLGHPGHNFGCAQKRAYRLRELTADNTSELKPALLDRLVASFAS